jgi:hypothetical protein
MKLPDPSFILQTKPAEQTFAVASIFVVPYFSQKLPSGHLKQTVAPAAE